MSYNNKGIYQVTTPFGVYECTIELTKYANNNNLAVRLNTPEEPFASLTVNLGEILPEDEAYIDTNNNPWAEDFLKEYNLGEYMNRDGKSGYCTYPLYKIDIQKIRINNKIED